MKKNIQFLGVFAKDEEQSKATLLNLTKYAIQQLLEKYENDNELQKMLNTLTTQYQFPNSIHMTTLFVGNNRKNYQLSAFSDFQEGLEQNLVIDGLAISPKNIVTAILNKNYDVPLTNQYSHITALLGDWKPKDSNTLLEKVFSQIPYEEMKEKVQENKYWKLKILQGISVYVIQFQKKIILPGVCRMN